MNCLVVYDITDDGQRKRLATMLQTFGLARIQYSAFRGELNANDRAVQAQQIISNSGACLVKDSSVQIV